MMSICSHRLVASSAAALFAVLFMLAGFSQNAGAGGTVTVTGNAYAFIFAGNESRLEGATIGIEELPGLTTTAGPNGAYAIEVPNDTTITPYAKIDGYYPTHLQTFHTSGQDLTQVNFQMPAMSTYNLLVGYIRSLGGNLEAGQNPGGSLTKCAIVSTFFQKEGRSFGNFDDFHDFRPHGVIGSTAVATPTAGEQLYFDEDVLPSLIQESSSRDGGVLWADVESGVYEIKGYSDTTRHSSFIATCKPGRLVNANPPWGLVELAGNEAVNPAVLTDTQLHARVTWAVILWGNGQRILKVYVDAREPVRTSVWIRQGERQVRQRVTLQPGKRFANVAVPNRILGGRHAGLRIVLTDAAGNSEATSIAIAVPRLRR